MDAIQRAYDQYMTDSRMNTEDDQEAFSDALFRHVVEPFERLYDRLYDRLGEIQQQTHEVLQDARSDMDSELGL